VAQLAANQTGPKVNLLGLNTDVTRRFKAAAFR
jgi:hypothetical protein